MRDTFNFTTSWSIQTMLMPWALWFISNTWKAPRSNVCPILIVFKEHVPKGMLIHKRYLFHRARLSRTTVWVHAFWKIRYSIWKLKLQRVTCPLHPESCYQGICNLQTTKQVNRRSDRRPAHPGAQKQVMVAPLSKQLLFLKNQLF